MGIRNDLLKKYYSMLKKKHFERTQETNPQWPRI